MIVGDSNTGKTTLLKSTQCEVNPELPTVYFKFLTGSDDDVKEKEEDDKKKRKNEKKKKGNAKKKKKKVLMSFWDVPGHESVWEEKRTALYPCLDAVVIVFALDNPTTLENARKVWYKQVRRRCGRKIPVILVGNKLDLRDTVVQEGSHTRMVSYEEGLKVAEKIHAYAFVECSALQGQETLNVFRFAIQSVIKSSQSCTIV